MIRQVECNVSYHSVSCFYGMFVDVDRIRQLEKQLSEKSTNLQTLKTFSEQKMTENNILRENLDITTRELDRTKLELIKLSDQSNPDIKHAYAGYPSITQTHG